MTRLSAASRPSLMLGLALSVFAASAPRQARAEGPATAAPATRDVDEARRRFQRGVQFYKEGDFRSALVEFEEANRVVPSFRIFYNIAQTCEELQDFAGATKALKSYVREGGKGVPADRMRLVEDDLRRLEAHVARVEITASEPGVAVLLEGERKLDIGKTPFAEAVLLNSGTWELTAQKEGFESHVERFTVAGGDTRRVVLEMTTRAAPSPMVLVPTTLPPVALPPSPPLLAPPPTRSMTPVWIAVGVTGALVVGASVTGGMALAASADYRSKLGTLGASASSIASAGDSARALALASDLQTGGAVVGAIVTGVLYFTRLRGRDTPPRAGAGAGALEWRLTPGGAGVSGVF